METKIIMDYFLNKLNDFIGEVNNVITDIEKDNNDVSRFEEIYTFKNMLCDASNVREIEEEKKKKREEDEFYNKQYEKISKWIYKKNDDELEEHYKWYDVPKGYKVELINTMFDSYAETYDKDELEKRCNMLLDEEVI